MQYTCTLMNAKTISLKRYHEREQEGSKRGLRGGKRRDKCSYIILFKKCKKKISRVFGYKNSFPSNNIVEEW